MDMQHILGESLNGSMIVFRGCTLVELICILGAATAVWLPVCMVLAWMASMPVAGLGAALFLSFATLLAGSGLLQRIKRGRPDGYYQLAFWLALTRRGYRAGPWVTRVGHWDVGRRR